MQVENAASLLRSGNAAYVAGKLDEAARCYERGAEMREFSTFDSLRRLLKEKHRGKERLTSSS